MDNYQANQSGYRMRCSSRGLMGPVVLVTLGVLFLLSEFHVASFHRTWPILLIMIGLVKVLGGKLDTGGDVEVSAPPPPNSPTPPPGTPAGTTQNPESRQVENV
jgi:hypothetical protein